MIKTKMIIASLLCLLAAPLAAGHANPWATDDDDLLMQYHEENLTQSEDTPGEDEMLGVMVQNARGKLEDGTGSSMGGFSGGGAGGGNGRN